MRPAAARVSTVDLEAGFVECTHCGVAMSSHVGSGGMVRYFHCPSCARWTTSVYSEVLSADTRMRARPAVTAPAPEAPPASGGEVKRRLASWLRSLQPPSPWQVLGCSPLDPDSVVRERYLALARTHHPDHGGHPDAMRRVNEAWRAVQDRRAAARAA